MKSLKTLLIPTLLLVMAILFLPFDIHKPDRISSEITNLLNSNEQGSVLLENSGYFKTLHFEANHGQANDTARYIARGIGYTLFLTGNEAVVAVRRTGDEGQKPAREGLGEDHSLFSGVSYQAFRLRLADSNPDPLVSGREELPGRTNYFMGSDPAGWITNIPNYARVEYKEVYPGIDLAYYGHEGQLEYDFIISPEGNPEDILLTFDEHIRTETDGAGNLIIAGEGMELMLKPPVSYQEKNGVRHPVFSEYSFRGENQVGFNIGDYDPDFPLVVDPVLTYASYLGTAGWENGKAIAVDSAGCVYVTGATSSIDFPALSCFQCDLYQGKFNNLTDVFITKFNPEGTGIVYSTFLGGNWDDSGEAIAVDANGRVYITGRTYSVDNAETPENEGFPLMNAYQDKIGDTNHGDAFVTVLNATGTELIYSSYLGGKYEDYGSGVAVDPSGFMYVTGTQFSFDFPVKNAFMDTKPGYYFDAFATKINPYTSGEASLVYSTHLGGNGDDYGNGIAVDRDGCAYVTGKTSTTDFPLTDNPIQGEKKGSSDVFVTKFSADGLSLEYSTYLGSALADEGLDIEVDTAGYAYVSGTGRDGFPTTPGAFIPSEGYFFVCKLLPDGSDFVYSTHTPFTGRIAVDDLGQVYIGAFWNSNASIVAVNSAGSDTLFTLNLTGDGSNTIRDIAVDHERSIYITGYTTSTNIATEGAYQTSLAGNGDVLVAKFGRPKEVLIVEVLQSLGIEFLWKITNTVFDIYYLDLDNMEDPLKFIETQATDEKGLLHLPVDYYYPGMPFLIRNTLYRKPAEKKNRTDADRHMYNLYIDNLIIDKDGNVEAQTLKSDPMDTTKAYVNHTSVGFNLVASIEWKASMDYINRLKYAFINASNLLYDVTNGHGFIDWVTVYDDAVNWDEADIQIYANNTQWPMARPEGINKLFGHVSLPPAFYNTRKSRLVQEFYETEPVNPAHLLFITSLVHELGHYAFGFYDEYEDRNKRSIHTDINFGFMDSPDDFDNPMSTEMSEIRTGNPLFVKYSETAQYQRRQMGCWEYFKKSFRYRGDGDLEAFILTPWDLEIPVNKVIEGPNSDLENPDFSVGSMMEFAVRAVTTTNPMRNYQVIDPLTKQPVIVYVNLEKWDTKRFIIHGKTTSTGHIKLFNAEAGDKIRTTISLEDNWKYLETLAAASSRKSGNDVEILELKSVSGKLSMLSGIGFNEQGDAVYHCWSEPFFNSSPAIRILSKNAVSEDQVLTGQSGTYSAILGDPGITTANIFFTAPDSLGETFFVPQSASIRNIDDLGDNFYFENMQLEFVINQSETTAEKMALLTSDFPAPAGGLNGSLLRVSDVISLQTFPDDSELSMLVKIRCTADSYEANIPEALVIYKWENGWIPLQTVVDLVYSTASANIDGAGYYAVFLDKSQSRLVSNHDSYNLPGVPAGLKLHPGYPNPFRTSAPIRFELPFNAAISLEIFDLNGSKVTTLLRKTLSAGEYTEIWDCRDNNGNPVPAGVYVCILNCGTTQLSQKMVLLR